MSTSEVFQVTGTLDRAADEIDRALAAGAAELTLDFSACTFISVEGLEWLEELLLRARSKESRVAFVNVRPEQYKVFKVAHIPSLLEACGSLARSGPAC